MDSNYERMEQRKEIRSWQGLALSGVLFTMIVVCSCQPEPIPIDGLPEATPQIVVSTQIIDDQSLVVLLTKSFGALDASSDSDLEELLNQIAVNDALVTISGPDGTDTLLFLELGFYGGITIPFESGKEYTLTVRSETLGEVYATTTVKPQITFRDISAHLYYNGFDDTLAEVIYSFNDPPGKNWYMYNVQEVEREDLIENLINPSAYIRLIDDTDFDGTTYSELSRVFSSDYSEGDTIIVTLSNVSEEYYDFLEKRIDNRYSFIEYLGEPVNYPSNVTGGKGFFNLYIPDVRTFVLGGD